MNAGDISVPKPASTIGAEKEGIWHPYGLQSGSHILDEGLKNPTELICRQFVVLWDMISPVGHILCVWRTSCDLWDISNMRTGMDVQTYLGTICKGYAFK